jgi:cobalt-precorrin-5B (C1)-methyltransferase
MSHRAVIETIKTEIDVHLASGKRRLLMTPGNYGRDFAEKELGLRIEDGIKCSNHIGDALDYASRKNVEHILLIGHAGKLVKLAGGVMNTHSGVADCRMEIIAAHSALAGAGREVIRKIMACTSTGAAIELLQAYKINDAVWKSIGEKIGFHICSRVRGKVTVEYIIFTQEHGVLCKGIAI